MVNHKYAYVTCSMNNDYLPGLFVLAYTLKKVDSKYPLIVMIPKESSLEFENTVLKYSLGAKIIRMDYVPIENNINIKKLEYWAFSTFKLNANKLTEYDKVVVLDTDLLIRKNIDDFFKWPHLSAGIPGRIFNSSWTDFNAGVIVIEPNINFFNKCLSVVDEAKKNGGFGGVTDQTILQAAYPSWSDDAKLHFPPEYHEYFRCVKLLSETLPHGIDDIRIIHYWGKEKPWDYDTFLKRLKLYIKNIRERRFDLNKIMKIYFSELKQIKKYIHD